MKTDTEIRIDGTQALVEALGEVNAERFIALIMREPFDYTKWQRNLFGAQSVEQISQAARKKREEDNER